MDRIAVPGVLPHRYPFLMIDRVTEVDPGRMAKGWKNVTATEWFFAGGAAVMPGTLVIEALAQLGAFAAMGDGAGLGFLSSLGGVEFLGSAGPGDRVELEYEVLRNKRGFIQGRGVASVNGKPIVRVAELMVYVAPAKV